MAERLTEGFVKALKPPARGSRMVWDSQMTGFALRVFAPTRGHPEGARTFLVSYWLNGTERRFRIGSWPDWSVMAARAEAKAIRQRVDRGEDPATARREWRAAATLSDLAERYKAEHLPRKSKRSRHDDGVMLGHILRLVGADRRVADVHHGDIVALHRAITESGHPVLANRTLACASRLFSLALLPMAGADTPWRNQAQGNPCKGVERNPEEERERYYGKDELARIADALAEYPGVAPHCVRLIMFTGCRPGEAMRAQWPEFDREPGYWVKPSTHTKQRKTHKLPLSPPAIELIERLRKKRNGQWVFPGDHPGAPITTLWYVWDFVRRRAELAKDEHGREARLYDLRHTFASVGIGSAGLNLPIIGKLLGHTQTRTTLRYAHLADDPAKEAANRIGTEIAGVGKGGSVVRLRGDS
jgi:integrase